MQLPEWLEYTTWQNSVVNNERIGFSEIAIAAKTTISRYPRIKIAKSCGINAHHEPRSKEVASTKPSIVAM